MNTPLLDVRNLEVRFPVRRGAFGQPSAWVKAVDGVSFTVARGEVLGLVGESGSGKSTAGLAALRLLPSQAGEILFDGVDIASQSRARLRPLRQRMQIVFQDPFASLNPRLTIDATLAEPMAIHGKPDIKARTARLMDRVGLPASFAQRYPHQLSGGQRQRVAIARALATEPELIVADEPVSALDVSIQAQILELLESLRRDLGLAMLLVAHNLGVVEYVCDRVAVMYLGRIVEVAPTAVLYRRPHHPYTRVLLAAMPVIGAARRPEMPPLIGEMPSPIDPPSGCTFRTRCPHALPACAERRPPLVEIAPGHTSACIRNDI